MNKKPSQNLSLENVQSLRKICNLFGGSFTNEKKRLLVDFSKKHIDKPVILIAYHDCLLFLLAYPENQELFFIATHELQRIVQITKHIFESGNDVKLLHLSGTGITNSYITAAFSFDLVKWLIEKFPGNISFYGCDADVLKQREILKILLPPILRESLEKNFHSLENWINESSVNSDKNALEWLIAFFDKTDLSISQRDFFYDALQVFVIIKAGEQVPSRTTARIHSHDLFYHNSELIRKPDVLEIISQKVQRPVKLGRNAKENLNAIAKCSLMMLHRENDPITYSNISGTELYDMGRGIRIAFYSIALNRRVPVGSTIGYMIFKNSIPVSYGEFLIFGHFASIAANVFEPFRGGESALLYCQLLRLLKQHYNITAFEAEPYQVGKNNSEGIKSGAFWFYYRMGFRPSQDDLFELAEIENNKIQKNKSYRTDEKTLRKLSDSSMILNVGDHSSKFIRPSEISETLTGTINTEMNGRYDELLKNAFVHLTDSIEIDFMAGKFSFVTKTSHDLLALLLLAKNLAGWNKPDKYKILKLFHLRELDNELQFILAIQNHKKLLNELYKSVHAK